MYTLVQWRKKRARLRIILAVYIYLHCKNGLRVLFEIPFEKRGGGSQKPKDDHI